ncbi:DUF2561 family protein [Mycobacterium sp. pUA109]|uniref:DUF2561 family protein n=1 Tax=Mycobacterium sp. pUA109 TaxID=3238982 RepID=UPI00351B0601
MVGRGSPAGRGRGAGSPATTDRILLGGCAAIWLILLGVSVAALVALVDLGRGFQKTGGSSHTALLYVIIGISALIIVGAIPLLLHARRNPPARPAGVPVRRAAGPPRRPVQPGARGRTDSLATEKFSAAGRGSAPPPEGLDRIWLRGTTTLVGALGIALTAVAGATYLMAVGKDGAAWAGYGVAAAVTAATPVIPWLHLRQLRELVAQYRP